MCRIQVCVLNSLVVQGLPSKVQKCRTSLTPCKGKSNLSLEDAVAMELDTHVTRCCWMESWYVVWHQLKMNFPGWAGIRWNSIEQIRPDQCDVCYRPKLLQRYKGWEWKKHLRQPTEYTGGKFCNPGKHSHVAQNHTKPYYEIFIAWQKQLNHSTLRIMGIQGNWSRVFTFRSHWPWHQSGSIVAGPL